jgi:hypothetical protein
MTGASIQEIREAIIYAAEEGLKYNRWKRRLQRRVRRRGLSLREQQDGFAVVCPLTLMCSFYAREMDGIEAWLDGGAA